MATVVRENIGLLHDKLTVKISKEDYLPSFEKAIKDYSKKANIPGFRKGMVPAGMVKKMYGQSVFTEEVIRKAETELNTWLDTEKPEIFAQPLPMQTQFPKLDMNAAGDYNFDFEIGLKPVFETADISKAKLTKHVVKATDEMVEEELNRMRIKGGNMTEPETIDNEENVLNVLFKECDKDGNVIEGGIEKENSLLLKYFTKKLQKQLMGKKKEDVLVFSLKDSFEGKELEMILQDLGFAKDDKEAAEKYFQLTLVKLGLVEKRELNEDFFKEVYPQKEIKTEEELRSTLKEEIQKYWDSQSRNQLHDQLYHYLLDETQLDFPADFLKRWLQTGGEKAKTAEEAEKEFPSFSNSLKWTLISDKIAKDNKLEAGMDDIKAFMKAEVMNYFGGASLGEDQSWLDAYVDRMLKDRSQVENTYHKVVVQKLFNWAEAQVTAKEKEVTPDELNALQHHHHH